MTVFCALQFFVVGGAGKPHIACMHIIFFCLFFLRLFSFVLLFIIMYIDYSCPLYFSLHRPSLYDNDNLKLSKRQFLLVFVIKYIFIRKNTIQTLVEVQKGGMVGTVVRSLLSDHKVPSLIQLCRDLNICVTFCT